MGNQTSLQDFYRQNGVTNKTSRVARAKVFNDDRQVRDELVRLFGGEVKQDTQKLGGGDGSVFGGAVYSDISELQNYGNSLYSRAKESLIRSIAKEVFKALNATGLKNADSAPIEDVVKNLAKLIPPRSKNPKKFNDSFNKNASAQRNVCHALANAINKHYGGSIIDMDVSEGEICNKVSEVMYSLFTGLHTEFMNVAGDVLRVMKNMQVVMDYMERAYKKQKDLAEKSGDSATRDAAQNTDEVYKTIKAEYDRQNAILANLMNVTVGPTGKSLISSLEDNGDFSGLVKDLKAQIGTKAFGDKLSYLLAGVSTVAHAAELIEKALKKIGMTVQEFKNAKNNYDLHMKVYNHIMKSSPSSKKLDEMMAAAKIIYDNTYDHDSVSKYLSKKGKGETAFGGEDSDSDSDSDSDNKKHGGLVMGGDDDDDNENLPSYWAKKSISKKINNKKKYRELVLTDFRKLLKLHYRNIVEAADKIAKHIGKDLPISDDLDFFVKTFSNLPNLDQEKIHIALSGYPKDSLSKEKREKFMNDYDSVLRAVEPLTKGPHGQLFKQVQQAVQGMIRSIDEFSDKMVKALTEIHVDDPEAIASAMRKTATAFYGSGEGDDDVFGTGSWVAFDKVKAEMKYYYSIANIKSNIARSHEDMKSYADDYEQILGEEAGYIINNIKNQYNELLNLDYSNTLPAGASRQATNIHKALQAYDQANRTNKVNKNGVNDANGKYPAEWLFKNLSDIWTYQMNAKVNMVNVAQAVDLYLKAFTDGVAKNPDSVSHITKILDQVEIVARWFNEKSGDNLASLFELFPCAVDEAGAPTFSTGNDAHSQINQDGKETTLIEDGKHYYEWLEGKWTTATGRPPNRPYSVADDHYKLPGNPFLGRPLVVGTTNNNQLKGVLRLSEKVVKSMRALENILSCFASIGTKFGELDPMASTFMNAGQMFNSLCQYISASAFTHQFAPDNAEAKYTNTTAAIYRGKIVEGGIQTTEGGNDVQTIPTNNHMDHYRNNDSRGIHWSENIARDTNLLLNGANLPLPALGENRNQYGILTGVASSPSAARAEILKYSALSMSAIPAETVGGLNMWRYHDINDAQNKLRLDVAGWQDNFYDTDLLFEMSVKAIVAKVFTIVDAYRLFHRPTVDRRSYYSLNPLRMILGGNEGGAEGGALLQNVKIIRDAVEFYYRLILLAEWYREKYGFNGNKEANGETWRLSIVPSVDGIWSDFIDIIFNKADYVKEGNYSETQVQRMIIAMNDIWKSYKSRYPKATVRNIINSFVLEMNRIFGFIKQKEIDAYISDRRSYLDNTGDYNGYSDKDKENFIDYDILNANDQFGNRPAPSDKFVNVNVKKSAARKQRNMIFLQEKIEEIRKKMDVDFINATRNNVDESFSFQDTLKNYKNEIEHAKNDTDAYKVILRMIQGANKYVNMNGDKLIMIHEIVAAPLVCLYGVYKVLARYNAFLHGCSILNLEKWSARREDAGVGAPIHSALTTMADARASYKQVISERYPKAQNLFHELFSRSFIGNRHGNYAALNAGNGDYPSSGYFSGHENLGGAGGAGAIAQGNGIPANRIIADGIMKDLLAAILDLSANQSKLVTCNVNGDNINIDWSALEDLCASTLSQVKENIKKLRNSFDPKTVNDVIDKFEDRNSVGSTRWLEEYLMECIFKDRDECGLPRAHTEHLKYTWNRLMKSTADGLPNATDIHELNNVAPPRYGSMANAVRSLLYYEAKAGSIFTSSRSCDFKEYPFHIIPANRIPTAAETKSLMEGKFVEINKLMPVPNLLFEEQSRRSDIHGLKPGKSVAKKSLFMTFNRILNLYIYTNYDDTNSKIYLPLVDSFINSAASYEVLQGKAYPNATILRADLDLANYPNDFGYETHNNDSANNLAGNHIPASPAANSMVWFSNATLLRSVITTTATIGTNLKKKYLFDNLAEVPEFMKERMKVNLPLFSKLLADFGDRATMLKNIINNTNIKDNINMKNIAEHSFIDVVTVGVDPLIDVSGKDSASMREYFTTMLTKLIELSAALRKCADNVYRELQDRPPHFFETSKDFLSDYRNRYGGLPVMPVSSILAPLRCMEGWVEITSLNGGILRPVAPSQWGNTDLPNVLMPVKENGSAVYRFNYATRALLAQNMEPNMEHFPGAKELYNSYASVVNRNIMVSPQEYADSIKKMIKLGKFLMDGAVYSRLYNDFGSKDLVADRRTAQRPEQHAGGPIAIGADRNVGFDPEYHSRSIFAALKWNDVKDGPGDLAEPMIKVKDLINFALAQANVAAVGIEQAHAASTIKIGLGHAPEDIWTDAQIEATATELFNQRADAAVSPAHPYMVDCKNIGMLKSQAFDNAGVPTSGEPWSELIRQGLEYIYKDDPHTLPKRMIADPTNKRENYKSDRLRRNMSILPLSDPLDLTGIIELTENSDTKISKERLATALGTNISEMKNQDRSNLRVYNILDMNIVPLNVHAFMREVPFVNLLNYSYTFDRMIHDFVLPSYIASRVNNPGANSTLTTDNIIISATDQVNSTRELLIKLLVHPYAKLSHNGVEYFALTASLFNGNDNLKLGRPRYLSDQLWHKVLMTSSAQLVAGQEMFNNPGAAASNRYANLAALEAGPSAYEAVRAVAHYGDPFMNTARSSDNIPHTINAATDAWDEFLTQYTTLLHAGRAGARNGLAGIGVVHAFNGGIGQAATATALQNIFKAPRNAPLPLVGAANPVNPAHLAGHADSIARYPDYLHDTTNNDMKLAAEYAYNGVAPLPEYKVNKVKEIARNISSRLNSTYGEYEDQRGNIGIFTLTNDANLHITNLNAAIAAHAGNPNIAGATTNLLNGVNLVLNALGGGATNNLNNNMQTLLPDVADAPAGGAGAINAGDTREVLLRLKKETIQWYQNEAKVYAANAGGVDNAPTSVDHSRRGLAERLEHFIQASEQFDIDLRGTPFYRFDAAVIGVVAGNTFDAAKASLGRNGLYHFLSIFVDVLPSLSENVRKCLKMIAANNMLAGATRVGVAAEIRAAGADPLFYNNASLFDKVMIEIIANAVATAVNAATMFADAFRVAHAACRGVMAILIHEMERYQNQNGLELPNMVSSNLVLPSNPVATPGLKVFKGTGRDGNWSAVNIGDATQNNMAIGDVLYCAELGKMRFDTKLVRNLTWLVNLQRIMRVIMVNHLSYLNTPVIKGLKIANPKVTEFEANEKFDEDDYNSSNYETL